MFKFKIIPRHNFLDGTPFWCVSSRECGYVDLETGQINIPFNHELTFTDCEVVPGITINSPEGDIIFEANSGGVFHRTDPLVTEERVREIFREEYYNILREDLENGV